MAVLQQTLIFLLLMAVGGGDARRQGIITEANQAKLSSMVFSIAYPAIILSGAIGWEEHIASSELLISFAAACALLLASMALAWLLAFLLGYERKFSGIINVMVVFTNIGFMGVPMIDGLYGRSALIYITIFLIPFNFLFYSYAVMAIRGFKGKSGFKLKDLANNGMAACFLAIIIYLADLHLPYVLTTAVHMLGSLTAPLAMLLMGSFLLDINWREVIKDPRVWLFTLAKLIVIPCLITWGLSFFIDNKLLLAVCLMASATPAGNVIALLCSMYNK